jgi:hypothetical protein
MNKQEFEFNQSSRRALETVERLLRGLSYDENESDPRLKGIDDQIADAVQMVNKIKLRVMGAVDADTRQFEERKAELEPLLKRCTDKIFENEQTIGRERTAIKNQLRRDEQQIEQMKSIGMSKAKIASVYTETTPEEIATVDATCAKLQAENERLHAFVADYPRYDESLLDGVEV